jgi:hypothetical protein
MLMDLTILSVAVFASFGDPGGGNRKPATVARIIGQLLPSSRWLSSISFLKTAIPPAGCPMRA